MKNLKISWLPLVCAAVITIAGLAMPGCQETSSNSDFQGSNNTIHTTTPPGTVAAEVECLNGKDDNLNGFADRYGVPSHCTIGVPGQTTALGSIVQMSATGEYNAFSADIYTITVTTPGGSGVAQVQVVSAIGDTGPAIVAPVVVIDGVPIFVGTHGLIIYFTNLAGTFSMVVGETWSVAAVNYSNCFIRPDYICYHPDAQKEIGICGNLVDDDQDGFEDDLDLACYWNCTTYVFYDAHWVSEITPFTPQCNDGIDNDGDGNIDLGFDTECTSDCDDSELVK